MLAHMGGAAAWLRKLTGRGSRDAMDMWSSPSAVGDSGQPTSEASTDEDLPPVDERGDWTADPIEVIPPWRRNDRALIDAARAATGNAQASDRETSAALARDLRRLADLNGDSVLDDNEFIAGVRARLGRD